MEYVIIWLLFGFVAMIIASSKGRTGCGWFILGCLFGPFSLVVAALPSLTPPPAPPTQPHAPHAGAEADSRRCPFCAEVIRREAIKCRFCGSDVTPLPALPAKPTHKPVDSSFGYEIGKAAASPFSGGTFDTIAQVAGAAIIIFIILVVVL